MVSSEADNLLVNLAKIERGISKIYQHLSKNENFTPPVKRFWGNLMEEELVHEKIFNDIRERAKVDDAFQFEIATDLNELEDFVQRLNTLLQNIKKENVSESEAYSFGATIEAEIDEADFLKKVKTNDPAITERIKLIELETKKHRAMIINYSKGIR